MDKRGRENKGDEVKLAHRSCSILRNMLYQDFAGPSAWETDIYRLRWIKLLAYSIRREQYSVIFFGCYISDTQKAYTFAIFLNFMCFPSLNLNFGKDS